MNKTFKIQELDKPNKNNRIYPKEEIEKSIVKFNETADAMNGVPGMIDYPDGLQIDMTKVSHVVKNLRIEDNYLVGDFTVLKTPEGKKLSELLNASPATVAFRTLGTGTVGEDGVVKDFTIISVSMVDSNSAA
jgi:hypothetical protein